MTLEMPPDINKAPHHIRGEICATRPPYREGRTPTAVKVFTVCQESRYLLIQGVPALGTAHDLIKLFATFGTIEEYRVLDDYPTEEFQDVYWIRYSRIQSARFAKRKLDDHSFFGSVLHVCYASEYESVEETREKLQDRRRVIAARTSGKDSQTLEQQQFVSGGVIDSTHSSNRNEVNDVTRSLNTSTQSVSHDSQSTLPNIEERGGVSASNSPIPGFYSKGLYHTSGVPHHVDSTPSWSLQQSGFANPMPQFTHLTNPDVLYTGHQTGAVQYQNSSLQSATLPWQQFGNFYRMPPPLNITDIRMSGLPNPTPIQPSSVTPRPTGIVQGVEGNAMKEWASMYSLPAPPSHGNTRGASRPRHPGVVKQGPRFEHARVPSSHATLPSGYDARLSEKDKLHVHDQENVIVSDESDFIEKQTLSVQSSSRDSKTSSANLRVQENPFSKKTPSQVVLSKTQNECPINEALSLKSNSRTGEIIIREYKKPGATPLFVPRQLKKKVASESDIAASAEQDCDKRRAHDALSEQVRKDALILREEQGPSLPDDLIVRKVAASDPVATTMKGIRKRVQQFSDRAPADCKAKKES